MTKSLRVTGCALAVVLFASGHEFARGQSCRGAVLFADAAVHVVVLPYESGSALSADQHRLASLLQSAVVAAAALPDRVSLVAGDLAKCDLEATKQALETEPGARGALIVVEGRLRPTDSGHVVEHRVSVKAAGLSALGIAPTKKFGEHTIGTAELRDLERDVSAMAIVRELPSAAAKPRSSLSDSRVALLTAGTARSWTRVISLRGIEGWVQRSASLATLIAHFPELAYLENVVERIVHNSRRKQRLL